MLPTEIVAAKVISPVFDLSIDEHRDRTFPQNGRIEITTKAICAPRRRTYRKDDAVFRDLRDRGKTPVGS